MRVTVVIALIVIVVILVTWYITRYSTKKKVKEVRTDVVNQGTGDDDNSGDISGTQRTSLGILNSTMYGNSESLASS